MNSEVVAAGRDSAAAAGEDVKGSEAGVYVNGEKVEGRFFDIKGKLCALGLSSDVSSYFCFQFLCYVYLVRMIKEKNAHLFMFSAQRPTGHSAATATILHPDLL